MVVAKVAKPKTMRVKEELSCHILINGHYHGARAKATTRITPIQTQTSVTCISQY